MKIVLTVCFIVFAANAWTIAGAMMISGFAASFDQLQQALELPWMKMAFTDLLTGFLLASAWIFYREGNNYLVSVPMVAALWLIAGFILLAVYVAVIVIRNGGDIEDLLIGSIRS